MKSLHIILIGQLLFAVGHFIYVKDVGLTILIVGIFNILSGIGMALLDYLNQPFIPEHGRS